MNTVGRRFATERLDLMPLRVADADEMVAVLGDPSLYGFTGGEPPTREELTGRYRAQVAGPPDSAAGDHGTAEGEQWFNWIVRERSSGVATGFVQATLTNGGRAADIAWVIGVPWQGRGYATEAATALVAWLLARGVATITAHVHHDHAASAAVAVRAGLFPTSEIEDGEIVWRRAQEPPIGT